MEQASPTRRAPVATPGHQTERPGLLNPPGRLEAECALAIRAATSCFPLGERKRLLGHVTGQLARASPGPPRYPVNHADLASKDVKRYLGAVRTKPAVAHTACLG